MWHTNHFLIHPMTCCSRWPVFVLLKSPSAWCRCSCILMILWCKVLFIHQESNVHYYLFFTWSSHWNSRALEVVLFVIISIIAEQIKHSRIIRTIERDEEGKKNISPFSTRTADIERVVDDASIRCLFSSSLFDNARARDRQTHLSLKRRINWYRIELLNGELIFLQYWLFSPLSFFLVASSSLISFHLIERVRCDRQACALFSVLEMIKQKCAHNNNDHCAYWTRVRLRLFSLSWEHSHTTLLTDKNLWIRQEIIENTHRYRMWKRQFLAPDSIRRSQIDVDARRHRRSRPCLQEIGRAHVWTPVT